MIILRKQQQKENSPIINIAVKTRSQSPLQEAKQIWVSPKPQSKRSVII
jgi:DNA topoisomerase VI subunit A